MTLRRDVFLTVLVAAALSMRVEGRREESMDGKEGDPEKNRLPGDWTTPLRLESSPAGLFKPRNPRESPSL